MSGESTRHVLVVDDERIIREGCRRVLERDGFQVVTSENSESALRLIDRRGRFCAALVDLKLPGMDGIEFIVRMRQVDEDIVPIVITGYASIETAIEATRKGAYSYVPKPFTPEELLLPVRQGVEKRALAIEARALREERERHLLDLAFERSRCRSVIQCMRDGVLVANREGNVVLRNEAAGAIFYPEGPAELPAPVSELRCPKLENLLTDTLSPQSGTIVLTTEIPIHKAVYMATASPVISDNGQSLGAVAVLRDITEWKKLEETKSVFVGMVAHEVKNPLAAIEGLLNVVLDDAASGPAEERDLLRRALARAGALRCMVSELISLMAMDTGRFALRRTPCEIRGLIQEAVDACRDQAEQKSIELRLESGESPPTALLDRNAVLTVFSNLIDNAIKYSPSGTCVCVRIAWDKSFVRVAVQDQGIGMTAAEQRNVFDEFYRVKNESTRGIPGTGLGLTLARRIVEMHHGTIHLESTPGKGSRFTVTLPIQTEHMGPLSESPPAPPRSRVT